MKIKFLQVDGFLVILHSIFSGKPLTANITRIYNYSFVMNSFDVHLQVLGTHKLLRALITSMYLLLPLDLVPNNMSVVLFLFNKFITDRTLCEHPRRIAGQAVFQERYVSEEDHLTSRAFLNPRFVQTKITSIM